MYRERQTYGHPGGGTPLYGHTGMCGPCGWVFGLEFSWNRVHIQQISLPPFSFLPKKGYFMKKYSLYVSECSEFSKYNLSIPNIFSLQRVVWVYGAKIAMEQGLKSGKSNNGTGYPEKTPAAHTRHFRGHVPPPGSCV